MHNAVLKYNLKIQIQPVSLLMEGTSWDREHHAQSQHPGFEDYKHCKLLVLKIQSNGFFVCMFICIQWHPKGFLALKKESKPSIASADCAFTIEVSANMMLSKIHRAYV